MYRIPTVMLIGAVCAAVAGCGEPAADTPTETAPAAQGGSDASMPIAGVRGDAEVRQRIVHDPYGRAGSRRRVPSGDHE